MHHLIANLTLLLLLLLSASVRAKTLCCGSSLIMRGNFAVEVLEKCGEPDFIDQWQQNVTSPHRAVPNVEQWYYNFGSSQLVQILEFREGVLERIDSANYGFPTPGPRRCQPADLVEGLSKYRLLELCVDPDQANSSVVFSNRNRNRNGFGGSPLYQPNFLVPVLREFWVYNFGRRRLLRKVILENGIVVEVDTEGRGFGSR